MIQFPSTHTVRDAGFKGVGGPTGPMDHFVIVGVWDPSRVRATINADIQIEMLCQWFGPRRCVELINSDGIRVIAADDADDVATLIGDQHRAFEECGMISDSDYWNKIAPLVEEHWTGLPLSQRALMVSQAEEEPELVFAPTVPSELFTDVALLVEEQHDG